MKNEELEIKLLCEFYKNITDTQMNICNIIIDDYIQSNNITRNNLDDLIDSLASKNYVKRIGQTVREIGLKYATVTITESGKRVANLNLQ